MVLSCQCGSHAIEITSQSYHGDSAFESYECQHCGRTGTLDHDGNTGQTRLSGCLE